MNKVQRQDFAMLSNVNILFILRFVHNILHGFLLSEEE